MSSKIQFLKQCTRQVTVKTYPRVYEAPKPAVEQPPLSTETKAQLSKLDNQDYYAILELYSRPYQVAKNDIIIANRMKLKIGDEIEFERIREVGNADFKLKGNPFIAGYFKVTGVVVEHTLAKPITRKHTKKSGLSFTVTNRTAHTMLRIKDISLNKDLE
jgi:ribosomal protein L21